MISMMTGNEFPAGLASQFERRQPTSELNRVCAAESRIVLYAAYAGPVPRRSPLPKLHMNLNPRSCVPVLDFSYSRGAVHRLAQRSYRGSPLISNAYQRQPG